MKTIKINFSDFWGDLDKTDNIFYNTLSKDYNVEISDKPDYLFFSTMGKEYLKYDCIRIFFTGENIRPDFNLADYAIGFDRLTFGDRYLRYPLYMLYNEEWEKACRKHIWAPEKNISDRKFCNFIYSNANTRTKRDEFFRMLSEYKAVDSGGRYLNNIGEKVSDKVEWQSNYKFTIAFENSVTPGYVTEKLIHAYAAGTVPIYCGDPDVLEDFDPNSMIICSGEKDFEKVIRKVIEVDQDDKHYEEMLRIPMLRSASDYQKQYGQQNVERFLCHIVEQPLDAAKRRSDYKWTLDVENELRFVNMIEKIPFMKTIIQKTHLFR